MVISFINESSSTTKRKESFEKVLKNEFKYVREGEIDVIFDLQSPTFSLGLIDELIFINIHNCHRNYYLTYPTRNYLHTLVIGFKTITLNEVIDADNKEFYSEEGSWNYIDEIAAESKAFDSFCYSISSNVKYFKSVLFYRIKANSCPKSFSNDYIFFNKDTINISQLLDIACRRCLSKKYNGSWSMQFSEGFNMHNFISIFLNEAEVKTKQGILTKKKMESIIKDSKLIDRVLSVIGSRLCVIKGNAGAGKTLALMKIAYRTVSHEFDKENESRSHNVRFLTYNNMLVYDIRNVLKAMGTFTASNLSVQTLHKFFYDIFKKAPVVWEKYSKDLLTRVNGLMSTCDERIQIINRILSDAYNKTNIKDNSPFMQIANFEKSLKKNGNDSSLPLIQSSNRKETDMYFRFLMSEKRWADLDFPNGLDDMREQYIKEKKQMAIDAFLNNVFINEYESILKDLYFLITDRQKFAEEHELKTKWDFFEFVLNTDVAEENVLDVLDQSVKGIRSNVRWSNVILVDEAQDCSIYEKALLYAIRGSENIVVATGGKDQLIRKPKVNDWTVLFGKLQEKETVTLRRTNWRQKANIVKFLNTFADYFNLESKNIQNPPETTERGKVIIDLRQQNNRCILLDKLASLRNQGRANGCSDYESLMVLLPHTGYTSSHMQSGNLENNTGYTSSHMQRENNKGIRASVDVTDTITFQLQQENSIIDFGLKEYEGIKDIRISDCTVSAKRDLNIGQCDTRFLYYDSCRGLEAWNVMCIELDSFFKEKYESEDARMFAIEQSGLIQEDQSLYQTNYAAIWCYMAMTRPMDTLYISIKNVNSLFSKKLLKISELCGDAIEIIRESQTSNIEFALY